ncbi:hypothetical protein B296_00021310 [Ensete ventricosum]|uniref:Uncharacterized protein n=1 Tax=Ensete ventricosum TaxID=4639 RepID=A0A426Y2U1_ENSVE|nr:hypothetical protein B296_00021310 [Ensete ventricosum]
MKLHPDDGPRSSLGIGPGSDDTVGSCWEFARRFTEGIGKLAGNLNGDHREKTRGLIARMSVAIGLTKWPREPVSGTLGGVMGSRHLVVTGSRASPLEDDSLGYPNHGLYMMDEPKEGFSKDEVDRMGCAQGRLLYLWTGDRSYYSEAWDVPSDVVGAVLRSRVASTSQGVEVFGRS